MDDGRAYAEELIRRLSERHPPRRAGSEAELEAQQIVAGRFASLGLSTRFEPFEFNDDLYAVLALHFGTGLLGTAVAGRYPRTGSALHGLAALSYWLDSTKRAELLRRVFPYRRSQNLLAVLPARGRPRLRIVHLAHIDAALTGLLFAPQFLQRFSHKGTEAPYPSRSLAVATHAEMAGAVSSALRAAAGAGAGGWTRFARALELVLGVPAALAFLLNAEVSLRGETVPGAADDLSGVAASLLLAHRFAAERHPEVELVYVVTGAEEAGTGGARRLLAAHRHEWDPSTTVVVGLDGMTNGELFWTAEGEMAPKPVAGWLEDCLSHVARSDERFGQVRRYRIPVGSTDAAPFLYAGYDATTLTCVELSRGAPLGYHHPSDTADNLDLDQLMRSVDFAEAAVRRICEVRLRGPRDAHDGSGDARRQEVRH